MTKELFGHQSLELEIHRDGQIYKQKYDRGVPQAPLANVGETKKRGTTVHFKPDADIFETTIFDYDAGRHGLYRLQ